MIWFTGPVREVVGIEMEINWADFYLSPFNQISFLCDKNTILVDMYKSKHRLNGERKTVKRTFEARVKICANSIT